MGAVRNIPFAAPLLLAVVGWSFESVAQPAQSGRGEALFLEARQLMLGDSYAQACPLLEESQRVDPRGGTLLNLAVCHERLGRIATAWTEFKEARSVALGEGNGDRAALAEERIAALEPRLPWLTISLPEPDDARVELDGKAVSAAKYASPFPIDPGEHLVVASAPGHKSWQQRIVVQERERHAVAVALAPEARTSVAAVPPGPPMATYEPKTRRSPAMITAGALLGAAGLGTMSAAIIMLQKASLADDREFVSGDCNMGDPDWPCHYWKDIDNSGQVEGGVALLVAGGAAVVAGTFMVVYGAQKVPLVREGRVSASVGLGSASMRVRF